MYLRLCSFICAILYFFIFASFANAETRTDAQNKAIITNEGVVEGKTVWLKRPWEKYQMLNMSSTDLPALARLTVKQLDVSKDIFGGIAIRMTSLTDNGTEIKSLVTSSAKSDDEIEQLLKNWFNENFYTENHLNNLKMLVSDAFSVDAIVYNKKRINNLRVPLPVLTKLQIKKIVTEKAGVVLSSETSDGTNVTVSFDVGRYDREYMDKFKKETFYTEEQFNSLGWSEKTVKSIQNGEVILGMSKAQAEIVLGKPPKVHQSVGSWGVREEWVYSGYIYFFENGILTAWQN